MGTKPAKVGHLAATLLKYVPKKQNKKQCPRVGSNPGLLVEFDVKAGVFPLHYTKKLRRNAPKEFFFYIYTLTKRSLLRGPTKCAKVGPPRARVKSAKVAPTPYV